MKGIINPTKEDLKEGKAHFPIGGKAICPSCEGELLKTKTGEKWIYLSCPQCGGKYKAERILIYSEEAIRLCPHVWEPGRISNALKPAFDSIREKINNNPDLERIAAHKSDHDLAYVLMIEDRASFNFHFKQQDTIRNTVDEAIKKHVSEEDLRMIARFVLYAVMQSDSNKYNKLLDHYQTPKYAISTDIKQISTKAKRKK